MYNTLNEIKEQLFDAPIDVKEAFNSIVRYFDDDSEYWIEEFKFTSNPNSSKNGPRVISTAKWKNRYKTKPANPRKGLVFEGFPLQRMTILEGPFNSKEEAQKKLDSMSK